MSRLHFLSKVIEKVVALRFNSYMHDSDLNEKYLSAYEQFHGTETVLVCVANDIRRCVNEKKAVLLAPVDLSAAFNNVDLNILLNRMFKRL